MIMNIFAIANDIRNKFLKHMFDGRNSVNLGITFRSSLIYFVVVLEKPFLSRQYCNPEVYGVNTILHIKTCNRYDTVLLFQTY